jgi:hypothetical protein
MKQQVFNPYLPPYEYVPDGEPRIFGDRIYIYGSHDDVEGRDFCTGDYVVWSAPANQLSDWQYHGISYRKTQDPMSENGTRPLFAPDVVQGADGRYYLYYCLCFVPRISVAVSENPEGPFEFYGYVKYPKHILDGKFLEEHNPFDPGVLVDEDKRVYLYYGFAINMMIHGKKVVGCPGSMVVELENDMLTVKAEPLMVIPNGDNAEGTDFEGHGFYEASSIRKRDGIYYFIYSSELSHELCYATSSSPLGKFQYGGIIISNGDMGIKGTDKPVVIMGNNHGSIIQIQKDWFVFYHRHTHANSFCRQGCAEKIAFDSNGAIKQVEITSCGLNQGSLMARGKYPSYIACHLTTPRMPEMVIVGESLKNLIPYICEDTCKMDVEKSAHFIANIVNGTEIGFKYFCLENNTSIHVFLRGNAKGKIKVICGWKETDFIGEKDININTKEWKDVEVQLVPLEGDFPIYFVFDIEGTLELEGFSF